MSPAQVKTKLRQSADDLGSPGKDKYFGHGRINALNAVQEWISDCGLRIAEC